MTNQHGDFIWYELLTSDPDAAQAFYGPLLGWSFADPRVDSTDYRTFTASDGEGVGGFMKMPEESGMPPCWMGYIGVDDVDATAKSIKDAGGAVHMEPQDIPGVGRFAFVGDPQEVLFCIMKGNSDEESHAFSYDRPRVGHCAWNELATEDPAAALHFYGQRFGWVKDGEMDMGEMGKYEFIRHAGRAPDGSPPGHGVLGAVMPKMPQIPVSAWTYYFRVPDIDAAVNTIKTNGGTILVEPMEIPGGDFSMNAMDPQGAAFALVGSRK